MCIHTPTHGCPGDKAQSPCVRHLVEMVKDGHKYKQQDNTLVSSISDLTLSHTKYPWLDLIARLDRDMCE